MTTPIKIWASGKASIIPTTDAQWATGFDYLATTNEGKPITDNHDFVFKAITEAVAGIQEKPIDDISNINHIKNPQFLANRLGNALAGENYAANAEIVDGWIAGASGCNGVTMTASGVTFTAGSMVYKYTKANGQLLADMKASILAPDGSILTDAIYVALTETASDFVVEVKLQAITDKTAIRSVKLERGSLSKHELLNRNESLKMTSIDSYIGSAVITCATGSPLDIVGHHDVSFPSPVSGKYRVSTSTIEEGSTGGQDVECALLISSKSSAGFTIKVIQRIGSATAGELLNVEWSVTEYI